MAAEVSIGIFALGFLLFLGSASAFVTYLLCTMIGDYANPDDVSLSMWQFTWKRLKIEMLLCILGIVTMSAVTVANLQ